MEIEINRGKVFKQHLEDIGTRKKGIKNGSQYFLGSFHLVLW